MKNRKISSDQFNTFHAALAKVLQVSHQEMQDKLAAEQAAKRKPKKASASVRVSRDRD